MKKLMITLGLAVLVFSMSTTALAASNVPGSSCRGNIYVSSSGCPTSPNGSGAVLGTDVNSLLDSLNTFGCSNGTVQSPQDSGQAGAAKDSSCYTLPEDLLNAYGAYISGDPGGNTSCPKAVTNAPAANSPAEPAPAANPAVLSAQTTQAADTATCSDNSCSVSAACAGTNCASAGNQCGTENCATANSCGGTAETEAPSSDQALNALLSNLVERCGANSEVLSVLLRNCTGLNCGA